MRAIRTIYTVVFMEMVHRLQGIKRKGGGGGSGRRGREDRRERKSNEEDEERSGDGERRSSSFDDNFQVGCVGMRWYHS